MVTNINPIPSFVLPIPLSNDLKTPPLNVALPKAPQEPSFFKKLGRLVVDIVFLCTLIPFVIRLIVRRISMENHNKLLYELQELKWRGLIPSDYGNALMILHADSNELKRITEELLSSLPESKTKGLNQPELLELIQKSPHLGFKKLKEHLQIASFYELQHVTLLQDSPILKGQASRIQKIFSDFSEGVLTPENKKKELYQSILKERSITLISNWIEKKRVNGEISSLEAKSLRKGLSDPQNFLSRMKELAAQKVDENGEKIGKYFWKELLETLDQIDGKKSTEEIGKLLNSIYFYEDTLSFLTRVQESVLRTGQITENDKRELFALEARFIDAAVIDLAYNPKLEYSFRQVLGQIRGRLRNISDTLNSEEIDHEVVSKQDEKDHEHSLCGCHFSFADRKIKQIDLPKQDIIQRQIVDISRSRLNLLANIKKQQDEKAELKLERGRVTDLTRLGEIELKIAALKAKVSELKAKAKDLEDSEKGQKEIIQGVAKPAILGFTCSFGAGHNMACQGVAKLLGNRNIHFGCADLTTDVLLPASFIQNLGKKFGQDWRMTDALNYIARKQLFILPRIFKWFESFLGSIFSIFKSNRAEAPVDSYEKELLRKRILLENPDQIFAFYHMDLKAVLEVAEEMGLPVTYIATDLNTKMEELFGDIPPSHPNFTVVTASNLPISLKTASPIHKSKVKVSSGAARPLIYKKTEEAEIEKMRKERNLGKDDPVVMFMAGGNGGHFPFPEALCFSKTWDKRIHLSLILGASTEFGTRFDRLVKEGILKKEGAYYKGSNPLVTIELVKDPAAGTLACPYFVGEGELSKMYDLCDVVFSKPGGSTIVETQIKNKVLLIDHRQPLLPWENDNLDEMLKSGRGLELKKETDFESELKASLTRVQERKLVREEQAPPLAEVLEDLIKNKNR
ncbi:hypothetical protein [Criblamydia sequanensis]|uniref:Conserved putative membrane protein n=1 Tax=Candidatus Criblamydia sequanensis CRIB-18 TaxID=1437425 RepID=A0A090D1G3_9BACT|nr:hypothetical protein [Criblamydia sequanensis]CDR33790.1 Conserved putative membrane protein [Criblamydia sequanensis CRIB-18]